MKFCPNCGHEVAENKKFCHECGEKLTFSSENYQQYDNNYQTQENNNNYGHYSSTTINTSPVQTVSKKKSIISFVLALVNIEISLICIYPYACLVLFPASLFLSIFSLIMSKKYVKEAGMPNTFSKIGKVFAIITLVLACICFLCGLVYTFDPEMNAMFNDIWNGMYNDLGGITDSSNGSSSF